MLNEDVGCVLIVICVMYPDLGLKGSILVCISDCDGHDKEVINLFICICLHDQKSQTR